MVREAPTHLCGIADLFIRMFLSDVFHVKLLAAAAVGKNLPESWADTTFVAVLLGKNCS